MEKEKSLSVQDINNEVELELSNKQTMTTLITTTFKGLEADNVKQAMVEGMLRGFKFKDFLEKNVYAIPFKDGYSGKTGYSLVTSIDYQQKIAMRSGVTGIDAPVFQEENDNVIACSVTVHRKLPGSDIIGDFTATVYMAEYMKMYNGKPTGLWATKKRTMIAKVARSHALRMACPEELGRAYIEEELEKKEAVVVAATEIDTTEYKIQLESAGSTEELIKIWGPFPGKIKSLLFDLKEKMKLEFEKKGI